jgi:hypothetical protein
MRRGIVEGEPGIFPDPIARLFVAIARFLRRRAGAEEKPPPETPRRDEGEERA